MSRLFKILSLFTAGLWLVLFPMAAAADSQPTYTWEAPAKNITFNAITDNPSIGDERDFTLVRPLSSNDYTDNLKVSDGQEVVIMAYYDNDAASNYNLQAKDTRVRINIPAVSAKSVTVTGYVTADNAKPQIVNDNATFSADSVFSLKYESGSGQIWNNYLRGDKLPDAVVSDDGALIGTSSLDGVIPGGPAGSGYVTIRAKVQFAKESVSTQTVGVVANTGPGQTAGLFFLASFAAAILHRVYLARRRLL